MKVLFLIVAVATLKDESAEIKLDRQTRTTNNFGKVDLTVASLKAKEMHDLFIFGVHQICYYPNA